MYQKLMHNKSLRLIGGLLGGLLLSVAINVFIVPQGLYGGGAYGLCQVIRTLIVRHGSCQPNKLHKRTSALVKASAQSEMIDKLMESLTEEELAVYKRGRNAKSYTMAKNATMKDYRKATGFEALMGYLYLKGETERLVSLVREGLGDTWAEEKKEEDRA